MHANLPLLESRLIAIHDPDLSALTGIDPEHPNPDSVRAELIHATCENLGLLGDDGNPIPEALEVIKKYSLTPPDSAEQI